MKKLEEMTLCVVSDAFKKWLFLAILAPLSFGYPSFSLKVSKKSKTSA